MSKTLLVLAASIYQLATIETAKRMGYRVVTTDNVAANPGHALADKTYNVDTTNVEAVLELAMRENISGIISPGTDVAVTTAAIVAKLLKLPGPSPESAHILTDKLAFRKFLSNGALPCPRVHEIDDDSPIPDDLFDGNAWLVKPCRASGSKGVFIVHDYQDYIGRVDESRAHSIDGKAILEEFIDGTQHTCEGLLQNGKVALSLITDRDTVPPPHTATLGHRVPSMLEAPMQTQALAAIEEVFHQLGVQSGPFDCDFVASDGRIVLIELTPRLGGNSLSKLFSAALDFDLVAYAVAHACADVIPLPAQHQPRPTAVVILGADQAGRVGWSQTEAEALRQEEWVQTLIMDHPPGTAVQPFINGRHRLGEALVQGANRRELDERLAELKRRIALTAT
jgi:biotin carboxylase